jgi:orotidine-5'-phosphate decarboxylase
MSTPRLIKDAPTLVLACDVHELFELDSLLVAAKSSSSVGALKIGFTLVSRHGIPAIVARIRRLVALPIIYDHQKAGTDIPDLAADFAAIASLVDAAILFPMAGPATQEAYTTAIQATGTRVIIGAVMTHRQYLARDGGYVIDSAPFRILELAAAAGVSDFVVPATNAPTIRQLRGIIETRISPGEYDLYSPGLVAQGGDLSELRRAAGPRWHAIVGRAIYKSSNPTAALAALERELSLESHEI